MFISDSNGNITGIQSSCINFDEYIFPGEVNISREAECSPHNEVTMTPDLTTQYITESGSAECTTLLLERTTLEL